MPNLSAIAERMDQALTRIEAAIEANLRNAAEASGGAAALAASSAEVEALKGECDRLRAELETIRAEHASLRQLADTVSARIDKAVGELQTALEG